MDTRLDTTRRDTRRTHGRQVFWARPKRTQKADTWRTSSRAAASFFFLRENATVNGLHGEKCEKNIDFRWENCFEAQFGSPVDQCLRVFQRKVLRIESFPICLKCTVTGRVVLTLSDPWENEDAVLTIEASIFAGCREVLT